MEDSDIVQDKLFDLPSNHISTAVSMLPLAKDVRENGHQLLVSDEENEEEDEDDLLFSSESNPLIPLINKNKTKFEKNGAYELKQRDQSLNGTHALNHLITQEKHFTYEIQPGDSLLSVSLLCNAPLDELRRANCLASDQQFYGLRYLKIPTRRYLLMAQALSKLNCLSRDVHLTDSGTIPLDAQGLPIFISPINQPRSGCENEKIISLDSDLPKGFPVPGGPTPALMIDVNSQKNVQQFMANLDQNLLAIRTAASSYNSSALHNSSVTNGNLNNAFPLARPGTNSSTLDCDGADCGLSWTSAIVLTLTVFVFAPLFYYFIWAEEKSLEEIHHHHH